MRSTCKVLVMIALMAFAPRDARAELILGNTTIDETFAGSGIWVWTYLLEVSPTEEIRTTSVFTIYDFQGFVPGSQMAYSADWTPTATPTGITPTGLADVDDPAPPDSPTFVNLSWTYDGVATIPSTTFPGNTVVGTFSAQSIYGPPENVIFDDWFAGEAYLEGSGTPGVREFNSEGNILVPENPVPEPGSMILLSTGLFGAASMIRRRRQAAQAAQAAQARD